MIQEQFRKILQVQSMLIELLPEGIDFKVKAQNQFIFSHEGKEIETLTLDLEDSDILFSTNIGSVINSIQKIVKRFHLYILRNQLDLIRTLYDFQNFSEYEKDTIIQELESLKWVKFKNSNTLSKLDNGYRITFSNSPTFGGFYKLSFHYVIDVK